MQTSSFEKDGSGANSLIDPLSQKKQQIDEETVEFNEICKCYICALSQYRYGQFTLKLTLFFLTQKK